MLTFLAISNKRDHCFVTLGTGAIYLVIMIHPRHIPVGWNRHDLKPINFGKFASFGHRGAGHAGQLVIHPKIILEGHRRQGLVFSLNIDIFFGFDGLMQTI